MCDESFSTKKKMTSDNTNVSLLLHNHNFIIIRKKTTNIKKNICVNFDNCGSSVVSRKEGSFISFLNKNIDIINLLCVIKTHFVCYRIMLLFIFFNLSRSAVTAKLSLIDV